MDQKEIDQVLLRSDKKYKVRSHGESFQENENEERLYHVVKDTFLGYVVHLFRICVREGFINQLLHFLNSSFGSNYLEQDGPQ